METQSGWADGVCQKRARARAEDGARGKGGKGVPPACCVRGSSRLVARGREPLSALGRRISWPHGSCGHISWCALLPQLLKCHHLLVFSGTSGRGCAHEVPPQIRYAYPFPAKENPFQETFGWFSTWTKMGAQAREAAEKLYRVSKETQRRDHELESDPLH